MKFENYKLQKDEHGFEFAKDSIMKGEEEKPCLQCGCKTKFIDVFSEAHFCSDECVDKFYEEFNGLVNGMNEEGED